MPVPYNMQFELNIMCKLNDDALQIVEQILPFFQPSYNLTVNLVSEINEKRDIPVVLENVSFQDEYEGDFTSRRVLYYTLRFTAKTYLFGQVSSATTDIIKGVSVRYLAGGAKSTERDVTYSIKPRAIKDYTGDVVTNLAEDIDATQRTFTVDDTTNIKDEFYIVIDNEEMLVKSISASTSKSLFREEKILHLLHHTSEELTLKALTTLIIQMEMVLIVLSFRWVMTLDSVVQLHENLKI